MFYIVSGHWISARSQALELYEIKVVHIRHSEGTRGENSQLELVKHSYVGEIIHEPKNVQAWYLEQDDILS